jgi:hypothetical protein
MVMTVTRPQSAPALPAKEFTLPTATGSVEIKFQSGNTAVEQAPCQIIIVQPESVNARSSEYTLASSGIGFSDEEPTWEDAAWQ